MGPKGGRYFSSRGVEKLREMTMNIRARRREMIRLMGTLVATIEGCLYKS